MFQPFSVPRFVGLFTDQFGRVAGTIATHHCAGINTRRGEFGHFRHRLATVRVDGTLCRGTDRELETLQGAVAELDPPGDRSLLLVAQDAQSVSGVVTAGEANLGDARLEVQATTAEELAQVRAELEGNLCRCTGYHNIVKAVLAASGQDAAALAAE